MICRQNRCFLGIFERYADNVGMSSSREVNSRAALPT